MRSASRALLLFSLLAFTSPVGATEVPVRIDSIFNALRAGALAKSYEIRIADEAAAQARAQRLSAWSRWLPRVDLQLAQTRSRDLSMLTSGTLGSLSSLLSVNPAATSLSRWEVDLTLPLYRRAVAVGVAQALADDRLAENRLEQRKGELDWRLRGLVSDYLLKRYKEVTLKNSIEIARKSLREAELRFELGQKTRVDVLRAKSNQASLESKRLQYQQEKDAALNDLIEYTGLSEVEVEESGLRKSLAGEEETLQAIEQFSKVDAISGALEPYLNEKSSEEALEAQVARASTVYSGLVLDEESQLHKTQSLTAQEWPELLLRGSLNKQADEWPAALTFQDYSYSAALVLNIPIFTGGALLTTHAEKRHAQAAATLRGEREKLHLRNDLENSRTQIRALTSSLEALKLSLTQNEEIVRLSFKSYQLGKSTILELLISQNDLIDSKITLAKARTDLAVLMHKFSWNLGVPLP